jgi:hypothetical protein
VEVWRSAADSISSRFLHIPLDFDMVMMIAASSRHPLSLWGSPAAIYGAQLPACHGGGPRLCMPRVWWAGAPPEPMGGGGREGKEGQREEEE